MLDLDLIKEPMKMEMSISLQVKKIDQKKLKEKEEKKDIQKMKSGNLYGLILK